MARKIDPENLAPRERSYPELIQRYIAKYRETKGPNAKRNTKNSNKWFFDRITKDTNLKAERVHRELVKEGTRNPEDKYLIGRLYLFNYDPKHKQTLPVYDEWPMTFFFNSFKGDGVKFGERGVHYLLGLNMHYLPPKLRLRLFTDLVKLKNDSTLRKKTRLKLQWKVINGLATSRYAEHAVKMYRVDHIRSRLAQINPDQWEICIPMQLARWKKGGKGTAWKL